MKRIFIIMLLMTVSFSLFAEELGTGLERTPDQLRLAMPQAQPNGLITEQGALPGAGGKKRGSDGGRQDYQQEQQDDYGGVAPAQVDLSPYLPPIDSQGSIGSCSAWSTIYYSKTLQENMERGWGADEADEIFSPLFTYNQITNGRNEGTAIVDHMAIVVEQGCATLATFPDLYNLRARPSRQSEQEAARYKADSYENLDTYDYNTGTWSVSIDTVKTQLASGYPVVVGFTVHESFDRYTGGVYTRYSGSQTGGHAMCIVGYDDNLRAFKIVNSWGADWGDNGFFWLSYDLFPELAVWGAGVLYDHQENQADQAFPPNGVEASQGTFTDSIKLTWTPVENTTEYIVYRSDNQNAQLEEKARVTNPVFIDEPLPEGVTYVYSVKSVSNTGMVSGLSSIAEGWTGESEQGSAPGIPANLDYYYNGRFAVIFWDEVDNADSYNVYRWDASSENWMEYATSDDGIFLDKRVNRYDDQPIAYYIVSAINDGVESYATSYVMITLGSPQAAAPQMERMGEAGSSDDNEIRSRDADSFDGEFRQTDYFDYEYTVQQFRKFYEEEQEAFRNWRQQEEDDFEAWKRENESWR